MDHVLLTRFNLPSAGAESLVRATPGWLRNRVELFGRYCLPSVLAQTNPRFKWLIYFDPESPDWLIERVREHERAGYYVPMFRAEVSRGELAADLAGLFEVKGEELLTTNVDNDDALAHDFVERLQAQPRPGGSTAYFLTNGLVKSPGGVYFRRDRHNAFASMRSAWGTPTTCWADWHNRLSRHVPVVEIEGPPGWLQVVHGTNVSNRTRGRLVSPVSYRKLFGELLDDIEPPQGTALARDRLIERPLRLARDSGRYLAKTTALKLLGPSGFERAKRLIAARVKSPSR